jgi:hypothetical protein
MKLKGETLCFTATALYVPHLKLILNPAFFVEVQRKFGSDICKTKYAFFNFDYLPRNR